MFVTDRRQLLIAGLAVWSGSGCEWMKNLKSPFQAKGPPLEERPASEFVSYVNRQADVIQALSYTDVSMTVGTGGLIEPGLNAQLDCMKPRSFRMKGSHSLQSGQMDVGSNDRQMWMYVRHAPQGVPNFLFASHDDLAKGRVQMPMPFDPDWIFMALGMSGIDPGTDVKVQIDQRLRVYEVSWLSKTPQGESVRKTTVFNGDVQTGTSPQVRRHYITNSRTDQMIATAEIFAVRRLDAADSQSGRSAQVAIPTEAKLVFFAPDNQKLSLEMKLRGERVNEPFTPEQLGHLFNMPHEVNGSRPVNLTSLRAQPTARGQGPNRRR